MGQHPRGVLRISSDRDDRMMKKIKTQKIFKGLITKLKKIPGPKFNPQKVEISKKFSYPKKSLTRKFQTQDFWGAYHSAK